MSASLSYLQFSFLLSFVVCFAFSLLFVLALPPPFLSAVLRWALRPLWFIQMKKLKFPRFPRTPLCNVLLTSKISRLLSWERRKRTRQLTRSGLVHCDASCLGIQRFILHHQFVVACIRSFAALRCSCPFALFEMSSPCFCMRCRELPRRNYVYYSSYTSCKGRRFPSSFACKWGMQVQNKGTRELAVSNAGRMQA